MARPLRIAIPGGLYHVISRGNDRQHVYLDDPDRRTFLELLAATVDRYRLLCHSYCLMGNHHHLLLETPRANLSLAMRQLNGLYAQRFNRRYGRCGHVFQARFRAILIQKESHLLRTARYIVRNPVRARICDRPGQWPWSSYSALAGSIAAPSYLCTDELLSQFARSRRAAQARYRSFVAEGSDEALLDEVRGERLGDPAFSRCAMRMTGNWRRCRGHSLSRCAGRLSRSSPWSRRRSQPPIATTATHCARSAST